MSLLLKAAIQNPIDQKKKIILKYKGLFSNKPGTLLIFPIANNGATIHLSTKSRNLGLILLTLHIHYQGEYFLTPLF